ncbi:exonuclease V isoform X4 [Ctenopharyngodon idella]|uniref:exonuclease V isoform X4 n=1 Tax=Ctenopharyngodon idella TaxID=7959 RepID=UPI00222F3B0C|nr:exonuclease V isoform X4 [Ctenopharyngodon idella]
MDASGSQQLLDDWDDISDSEFLNIPSEQQNIDPQRPLSSETDGEHSVDFDSPSVSTSSVYNHDEEALGQETVKTDYARGLKRKSLHENSFSPMQRFLKRHLSVTLLCDQSWCEMKTVYSLLKPYLKRKDLQRTEVQIGKEIHLSRELEIQDTVPIDIRTREDAEAIKLLNMLHMIPRLEAGECVREFPVFGVQEGVFVMGVIDELMYNQKGELVLNELKTRKHNSMPSSAQDKVNCFQLEYYHQGSSGPIGNRVAPFDEAQLRAELQGYLAYWTGQREPKGVDIEEAWKCRSCLYERTCEWRKNRLQVSDQQTAHASSCS